MSRESPARRVLPLADLLLFAVAMVWGSSYGVVKSALAFYPVLGLLTLRFGITFCLLAVHLRHLRSVGRKTLVGVVVLGLLLLSIFLAETFGVLHTRAANAAFLISLCVVLTPLVEWGLLRRRPSTPEWVAVGVSFAGAWLLASNGTLSFDFNLGDGLILAAAVLRALSVCVTKRVLRATPLPALTVTAVQAGVVTMGSAAIALTLAPSQWQALPSVASHAAFWGSVLYLVFACTLFAFFAQNYAIGRSSPTRVSLLMGSEPAFGALFASVWLGEHVSTAGWIGGAMIVAASLMASVSWRGRVVRLGAGARSAGEA